MKELYRELELEVICFESQDIITASDGDETGEGQGGGF